MPIKNQFQLDRVCEQTSQEIRRIERTQDFGYFPIGGTETDSLNPVGHKYMIEDVYYMWLKNPLGNNIIETFQDFVIGDGIEYSANDDKVKEIMDEFWNDEDNNWDIKGEQRIRDLSLYGELILKDFDSKFTGKVKTVSLYPGNVSEVNRDNVNPERIDSIKFMNEDNPKKVIKWNPKIETYEGEIFYFKINSTVHQTRGLSDLFNARDWLRMYDKALYSTMERIGLLLSFVWDITIKNAGETQLREKLKAIQKNPPQPGGVWVHNESEERKEITPSLGGRDFEDIFRLFKSQPIASARMPEHFFGMGGDVNYATALSMNSPFYKKIRKRQKYIKYMFNTIFNYVIFKKKETQMLNGVSDFGFDVILANPDKEIAKGIADTLFKFANAVVILETNGYIGREDAQNVISVLLNQLGVEINTEEDKTAQEAIYDKLAKAIGGGNGGNKSASTAIHD